MSEEWDDFRKKVESLKKRRDKLSQDISAMYRNCTHEEKVAKSQYFSGDYYNKASTDSWFECSVCGKRFEEISRSYSYYG